MCVYVCVLECVWYVRVWCVLACVSGRVCMGMVVAVLVDHA